MSIREITFSDALHEALYEEMLRDETVFVIGEDVRFSYWSVTRGLVEKFGEDRVIDSPISESAIVGSSIGAALMGMRPVAEIMYAEFLTLAMNHLANFAPCFGARTYGEVKVPLVVRTRFGPEAHSQNYEAWFVHVPGLKVVMPSTPYDAKGLLKSAIRDDNPVLFFEHIRLYNTKGPVPEEEYVIPLSKADIKRKGSDVTVVATAFMVHRALKVAERLQKEGIDVEVIDLRTLKPLDRETLVDSIAKTGRLVIIHEAWRTGGIGGEIVSQIIEDGEVTLKAPPCRVGAIDVPLPHGSLLDLIIPDEGRIAEAIKKVMAFS